MAPFLSVTRGILSLNNQRPSPSRTLVHRIPCNESRGGVDGGVVQYSILCKHAHFLNQKEKKDSYKCGDIPTGSPDFLVLVTPLTLIVKLVFDGIASKRAFLSVGFICFVFGPHVVISILPSPFTKDALPVNSTYPL